MQVSQSLSGKLMRVDPPRKQPLKKSGLDLNVASECQLSKHKDTKGSKNKAIPSSSTLTLDVNTTGKTEHDFNQSGMEADEEVGCGKSPGSSTSVKRWVIGPLFQSFKSKMASFTQIVMSPVRLFKPNGSPPEPDIDVSSASHSSHQQGPGYKLTSDTVQHFEAGRGGHDPASNKHLKFSMDLKTHGTPEEDEFSLEGKQNMMPPGDAQRDTRMSNSSEKETNNNDSLPCMQRSPVLRSSIKCGSESTESQFNSCSSSSFQLPVPSSSSCGSKLSLIVQMEEQVDLTGAQRRPLRRKCAFLNEAASQSSPSAATSASEADRISSLPAEVGICEAKRLATKSYVEYKIWDCIDSETSSPLSSSIYDTPSESLCQADDDSIKAVGLPQDRNMLVCGSQSHMSIRKSPRKPVNTTLNNCASVSQCLQKQIDECEGKQGYMPGTAKEVKRRCRATHFTAIKRDAEKKKRVKLTKRERCEEVTKEDTVDVELEDVELESYTLTSVKHASDVELVQPGVGTKPCTTSKSQSLKSRMLLRVSQSSTVHIETTQKPSETHVPLMEVKGKGRGRSGRIKKNTSLTVMATSSNGSVLEHSNGSLCDNSIAASNVRGMTSALSYGDTDSSSACNMEMVTTMTTALMKENHELPISEQHLDIKGKWPQTTSKSPQKYICKKRKISPVVEGASSQNQHKCLKLNEIASEESRPLKPRKENKSRRSHNSSSTQQLGTSSGLTDVVADHLHSLKPSKDDNVHVDSRSSDVTQQTLQTTAVVAVHNYASWGAEIGGSDSSKSLNGSNKTSVSDALLVDKRFVEPLGGRKRVRGGLSTEDNDETTQSLQLNQIKVEDKKRTVPWPVRTYPKCSIKLNKNIVKHSMAIQGNYVARDSDVEVFSTASEPTNLGQNKTVDQVMEEEQGKECSELPVPSEMRPRGRGQKKKPKKAATQCRKHRPVVRKRGQKEEERNTAIGEQMDFSSDNITLNKRLLRSYSCPEIPALLHHDSHWTTSLHGRILSVPRLHPALFPPVPTPPAPSRRPRRHTVSSVEIEREIAPLCLRKEVFPSRRSYSLGNPSYHMLPSVPLSTSISVWASCFLSSPLAFLSRKLQKGSLAATSSACSHDTSSSPSSVFSSISPSCSSVRHLFSSSDPCDLTSDIFSASVSSLCRVKKKEFSLEEIYTNKNFTKPPERRLETIFEVPLSRRDGSHSLLGQKRMKRFVEFPEVGVARKPRKPLVGAGAGGGLPRKAGVGSPFGRPKRGGCPSSKDHLALNLQELDSLLCSKLDQLDSWLAFDQKIC
uniref:Tantalus-like domain-containing protein n=1 Tax=Hucho hucho TaxID=62062 RepID=A0A4W5Q3Y6_9TELE